MEAHRQCRWPLSITCEVLGISRSGYYRWKDRQRQPGKMQKRHQSITLFLLERAKKMNSVPGYRKLWMEAQDEGYRCGKNQVQRLLQEAGYRSCTALKPGYRRAESTLPVLPNLLNRRFSIGERNKVWVSDITQIRCQEGWLYLAVVMDLGTRQIVGYAQGAVNSSRLVLNALESAWRHHQPAGRELLFHSDQGTQYRSEEVM
ncbi:IS3 family transposase, partial [Halomonas sp. SIMBA_159]